jgi:hypothetical protein
MTDPKKNLKGPDITKSLFGGVFDIDGAGHFPGLELINFITCCTDGILPGEEVVKIKLRRMSHDFARRLVAEKLLPEERSSVLLDAHSEHAVAHLLRCLELDVQNTLKTKTKSWERTHFFPYTRSLVHWDARERATSKAGAAPSSRILLERRYLRGGGAYAFSVLRHDTDADRLAAIRQGFSEIYPTGFQSPLERLAATLLKHGESDREPATDPLEPDSDVRNDHWDNLYRDGIRNILSHHTSPSVQRIRAIMDWTGIWLVLLEAARAAQHLDRDGDWGGIVLDCAGTHPQLRRASQKCLKEHLTRVEDAANAQASRESGEISRQQMNKIKGFFGNTAAACGLLNSSKGRRHFTLKLGAIEALVLASTEAGRDLTFESFISDWLGQRCGLIIGREAAAHAGMLTAFDATIFEENERQFAEQMRATGMLRVYSDATRMVSPEVIQ